ncbi:MAG: NusG domain II-containing protein [Firmicutes bacterium]|nr:NusG domain II-containing protein [Bacillota bacterium]
MKKGDLFLLVALLGAILVSGLYLRYRQAPQGDIIAVISVDNQPIQRINLSRVQEPYTLPIRPDSSRYNLLAIEPGRIRVLEANCPNQIDVRQGWISDSTRSIVCVPNRLVVRIESSDNSLGIDGVVQ